MTTGDDRGGARRMGDPVNPDPSPAEQKAAAEEYLTEALDELRGVLAERPDGMIPYERMALQAIKRVEAQCLNWKRVHGLISREELTRVVSAGLSRGGDRIIGEDPVVVDFAGQ